MIYIFNRSAFAFRITITESIGVIRINTSNYNNSYYVSGLQESVLSETYSLTSSEENLFPKIEVYKSDMKIIGFGIKSVSLNASNVAHQSGYNMIPSIKVSCDGTYLTGSCYMQSSLSGNIAFGTITVNVYYQTY